MGIAHWMILIAAGLPYATVGIAKFDRSFDNSRPREWLDRQSGLRRRADWAHRNHFEAFAPFAAAVILCELAKVPQRRIDFLAVAFVVIRLLYTAVYLMDLSKLRSLIWLLGAACVVILFVSAA